MKTLSIRIGLILLFVITLTSLGFAQAGTIITVAGNGQYGFDAFSGFAISLPLKNPRGVTVDAVGNIIFADSMNFRICKVTPAGVLTNLAGLGYSGFGGDGGPAINAILTSLGETPVDSIGNLYFSEPHGNRIRKVDSAGIINTVVGTGVAGFSGDNGPATSAQITAPQSVWVDGAGNLFIGDYGNNRIRKVDANGIITTIVGIGRFGYGGDGGPATAATIYYPMDVTVDSEGNLYFADIGNNRIRKVLGSSAVTGYFSQLAVGSGYKTFFTVTNTGPAVCSADLILSDSSGQPLIVNGIVDNASGGAQISTNSTFSVVVPSGGISFVEASCIYPNTLQVGWARLVSSRGSLSSAATFEYRINGIANTMVAVPLSQSVKYATIPVDTDPAQRKLLAFAVANLSGQTVTVKLALVAADGTVVDDTRTITLDPQKHVALYLDQLVWSGSFKGTLVLRGMNDATFIMLAMLDKEGILTSLPVINDKAPGVPQ